MHSPSDTKEDLEETRIDKVICRSQPFSAEKFDRRHFSVKNIATRQTPFLRDACSGSAQRETCLEME